MYSHIFCNMFDEHPIFNGWKIFTGKPARVLSSQRLPFQVRKEKAPLVFWVGCPATGVTKQVTFIIEGFPKVMGVLPSSLVPLVGLCHGQSHLEMDADYGYVDDFADFCFPPKKNIYILYIYII